MQLIIAPVNFGVPCFTRMEGKTLFQSLFKSLQGQLVIVELKNNAVIKGELQFCDNYYNLKLVAAEVLNKAAFPQLPKISSVFIRGSSICYVHLPPEEVDLNKLHFDAKQYNANLKSTSL